jgi:hypothetical protein
MKTPHFLRFVQSLALGAGMLTVAGCGSSSTPDASGQDVASNDGTSNDVASSDTVQTDSNPCSSCQCGEGFEMPDASHTDASLPLCSGDLLTRCCGAIGPLPPPDLSA